MIKYDALISSQAYQSLDGERKQKVKKHYLDDISGTEAFQSLDIPQREKVVYHTLFSDAPEPEERVAQSKSMLLQGMKGVYKAAKPFASIGAPLPALLQMTKGKFYEQLPEASGTPAKVAEAAGGFAVDAPLFAILGEAFGGLKWLQTLGKARKIGGIAKHAVSTGMTMGGVEALKSPGRVISGEETLDEVPGSIAKTAASGAVLGAGGAMGGELGGRIAEKFAPEYIALAQKTANALGFGGTAAAMSPEGEKLPQFIFGTGLGLILPGTRDPISGIREAMRSNLDYARTKGLRPSVVGKRTTYQQERFKKSFDDVAMEIISRKGQMTIDDQGNPMEWKTPTSMVEYAKQVDAIRREAGEKVTEISIREGKKGNIVNTDSIVQKVIRPALEKTATGETSADVGTEAAEWSRRLATLGDITPVQAENLISELNAKTNKYFRAGYFGRGTPADFLNNLRAEIRTSLMDSIEKSIKGSKEYEIAREKWSSATSLLNDANQRALVAGRASPKGFFDLADMYSTSQGVEGGLRILFGDPIGGSIQVAKAGVAYTTKRFIKNLNNADSIIKRTFRNIDLLNERAKNIGVAQKSAKDVILYLRSLSRGARQQVFQENPEFANDIKQILKPYMSLSYEKGKGVSERLDPKKLTYQTKMLQDKSNIVPLEEGVMYKKKPALTAEIQPGYEQTKAFLQEIWEDLKIKSTSEKGQLRIGKDEPFKNPTTAKGETVHPSRIYKLISDNPQGAWSPQQLKGFLQGKVSQNEIDTILTPDLMSKPKIMKSDILQTVETNMPKIEVVRKTEKKGWLTEKQKSEMSNRELAEYEEAMGGQPTKFSQYQLPGGKKYQETLIKAQTLSKTAENIISDIQKEYGYSRQGAIDAIKNKDIVLSGRDLKVLNENPMSFTSSHWDEPNVLAHVRHNDRVTPQGEKVRFLEEIQSDWAKAGRGGNFVNPNAQLPQNIEFIKNDVPVSERLPRDKNNDYRIWDNDSHEVLGYGKTPELAKQDALKRLRENGIVSHPLLKNWQELALKQALKDAANSDAKYLSWTTGEQQAARYDLSKQVDGILVQKLEDGWHISAFKPDRAYPNQRIKVAQGVSDKELPNLIGKDLSQKVLSDSFPLGQSRTYEKKDLKVGGEWAKNLYDKQIPNILKKLTGQDVEMIDLGQKQKGWKVVRDPSYKWGIVDENGMQDTDHLFNTKQEAEKFLQGTQPAIRLTPELKSQIKSGKGKIGELFGLVGMTLAGSMATSDKDK